MTKPHDIVDRELDIGDYVVFYNNLYRILGLGQPRAGGLYAPVRIILVDRSKTTRSIVKNSREMCRVDAQDVTAWKLKHNIDSDET